MLNFTVGPVMMDEEIRRLGAEQIPYFRTAEFSEVMLESETLIKRFAHAKDDARAVFITGSGTASMEAAVINSLTPDDKVIVIDGGSFGHRFAQLCDIHRIPFHTIELSPGKALTERPLEELDGKGYTALLVNVHETSTGVLYDMGLISEFCKRNHLFLIVDAISSFLADDFDMASWGVDIMIAGSQKALACPPGVSLIVLSARALGRVQNIDPHCMYLDLQDALKNAERGQTPFTPAVGTLLQIHSRLKTIEADGVENETMRIARLARDFRKRVACLPLDIFSESLSNALTPLSTRNCSAHEIFLVLKNEYGIWICPNGGELRDAVFRVGHIGALTEKDNVALIDALCDLQKRGILR